MPKILHTADWHWGAPGVHPFYTPHIIPALVTAAEDTGCDYILVAGDVFDKPKPDQQIKDALVAQLLEYQKNIKFIFSVGNHDYTTKSMEYHSLNYLHYIIQAGNGAVNIALLEPGEEYSDDNIRVHSLESLADLPKSGDKDLVLVWHGTFPGIDFKNIDGSVGSTAKQINRILKKTGAVYFALGDIHRPLCLVKHAAYYSGPPVQKTFADESGYVVVDTDKQRVSVNDLPLPKKINCYFEDYSVETDTEAQVVADVIEEVPKGSFVKLRFELPLSAWATVNHAEIKDGLEEHCTDVLLDNTPTQERRTRTVAKKMGKALSMEQEVAIVVDDSDVDVKKEKLKKICCKYL